MTKKVLAPVFLSTIILLQGIVNKSVNANPAVKSSIENLFSELSTQNPYNMPSAEVFAIAYKGYLSLKAQPGAVKKDILTVIDFSLPSTEKRLWIIDLESKTVLFNDFVAHGRNSGDNLAASFSNFSGSNKSSIGFYVTAETYTGKHGLSLRLEGKDDGLNCNARSRAIVMHGAEYVSKDFITKYGRLGRSLGCPSVSMEIHEEVINMIKEGSALLIYYPDPAFLQNSRLLNSGFPQPA